MAWVKGLVVAAGIFVCVHEAAAQQVAEPDWLKKPSASDLLAVFPRTALRQGVSGSATLRCAVTVQGVLRACHVADEAPAGKGFGDAALVLSRQFQMRPAMRDGKAIESTANVTIHWARVDSDLADRMLRQDEPGLGTRLRSDDTRNNGSVLSGLVFTAAPTVTDVAAAFPAKAREARTSGRVTLSCRLNSRGGLEDCESLVENPRGYGFAAAARALAAKFRAPAVSASGQSLAGATTQLNVVFDAAALSAPEPVVGKPKWIDLPSPEDFARTFTDAANKAKVNQAHVVMTCLVGPAGVLSDCQPASESPAGYGIGAGAAALAGKFRVAVWTDEGLPTVGGRVRVPITFNLTDPPPKP